MRLLRDILICALLLAVTILASLCGQFVHTATATLEKLPRQLQSEFETTRAQVLEEVAGQASGLRGDLTRQLDSLNAGATLERVVKLADRHLGNLETIADGRAGEALLLADRRAGNGLQLLDTFRRDFTPTLTNADELLRTYTALPGQLSKTLEPSWMALQPEITCRTITGQGYGGCWHSRITGLFGEAEKVGGVFTQKFPSLADSMTGIASDLHVTSHKYLAPGPSGWKGRLQAAGKITLGLGTAALRGGVF